MKALSEREQQIVKLLADGYNNEEVSEQLGITKKTIESHRARIMLKLGIHDLTALVKYAIRTGLTSVDTHREDQQ